MVFLCCVHVTRHIRDIAYITYTAYIAYRISHIAYIAYIAYRIYRIYRISHIAYRIPLIHITPMQPSAFTHHALRCIRYIPVVVHRSREPALLQSAIRPLALRVQRQILQVGEVKAARAEADVLLLHRVEVQLVDSVRPSHQLQLTLELPPLLPRSLCDGLQLCALVVFDGQRCVRGLQLSLLSWVGVEGERVRVSCLSSCVLCCVLC